MSGKLDAIVVVYQRTQFLPLLLPLLGEEVVSRGGRLVVVDNGNNTDVSEDIAACASSSGAILIKLEENLNHGAALNRAMLEIDSDAVLIAHSDSVPSPGCISKMLSLLDGYDAVMPYTNCSHIDGVEAGLSGNDSFKTPAACSRTVAVSLANDVLSRLVVPTTDAAVESIDTFFLLLRRDVILALGAFDESIFHRDARIDTIWCKSGRFRSVVAGGTSCFHYGGFTMEGIFPRQEVAVRTNDLILFGRTISPSDNQATDELLRNAVFRFDAEVRRASRGPIFGNPIHLLHVGQMGDADAARLLGAFESHSVIMPEDTDEEYDEAVRNSGAEWIMVLKAGEYMHAASLPGLKRLTTEPYDAAEFPFMLCAPDGRRCLLGDSIGRHYPFGEVRLFRKDSGCRVMPGGEVIVADNLAIRRADKLHGAVVLQHIFETGAWSGKWLDNVGEDVLPSVAIAATDDRLRVAISVATLHLKRPIHQPSYMASFGLRDAFYEHPNVASVDCFDGEWSGRPASNNRAYSAAESPNLFLSVDEMRPAPDIAGCATICWVTTTRFLDAPVTPASVASLGYDKYFASSRRFCAAMRSIGSNCEFLSPATSCKSRRQFTNLSARCQVGLFLRARPSDWDVVGLQECLARLMDIDCKVFGNGWEDAGRIRRAIAEMPRVSRAIALGLLDEITPLLGPAAAVGQEPIFFSGMRCLLHVPSPQDAEFGFVPYNISGALATGTPVVLLDVNGQFDAQDFGNAPVYVERTPADAAQRAAEIVSMSFDDLAILSDQAKVWLASNSHEHRVATVLASLVIHPGKPPARTSLVVEGRLDSEVMDRIRFQAGLRGIDEIEFQQANGESDGFDIEFRMGPVALHLCAPVTPSASQVDGILAALG